MLKRFAALMIALCFLLSGCGDAVDTSSDVSVNSAVSSVSQENSVSTSNVDSSVSDENSFESSAETSSDATSDTFSETSSETSSESSSEPKPIPKPAFAEMPEVTSDFAEICFLDNAVVFTLITSGMDSSDTKILSYDIYEDKLLGELDFADDVISIFKYDENSFAVLSHINKTFSVYDKNCALVSSIEIEGIDGELGTLAGYNGNLIYSDYNGNIYIYDFSDEKNIKVDFTTGYTETLTGNDGENFLISVYDRGLYRIFPDGSSELFLNNADANVIGKEYAAGVIDNYCVFFSLSGKENLMSPRFADSELFCSSNGKELLSRTYLYDDTDTLFLYSLEDMTVLEQKLESNLIGASLYENYAICVTREDYGKPLGFSIVDFSDATEHKLQTEEYDYLKANGVEPLPEPTGNEKTVELIKRYEREYGIRIVFEAEYNEWFSIYEQTGYTLTTTDEDTAFEKMVLLETLFEYLPDGLLRELGSKKPVVLYLCDTLDSDEYGVVGGMNTSLNGYNLSCVTIGGNDAFFLATAAHELGHAIEQGIRSDLVYGWYDLMPDEVRLAYGTIGETEYTFDDNGKTPVWFVSYYAKTSDIEDRAEVFSVMFNAIYQNNSSLFEHEGIKQKAQYWNKMLRESFESCKNVIFSWESLLN